MKQNGNDNGDRESGNSRTTLRSGLLLTCLAMGFALSACSSDEDNSDADETSAPVVTNMPSQSVDTTIGQVWVGGDDNLTLYILPDDEPNTVTCIDACADAWPPLTTEFTGSLSSGPFGRLERPDGTLQWTYKGYPLYFYRDDVVSTDTNGEGLGNQWFVARPDPVTSGNTSFGETLVSQGSTITVAGVAGSRNQFDGRTLYTFESDPVGQSTCFDAGCLSNWPPLYADRGSVAFGNLTLVARTGEPMQWAYDGKPLYYYVNDSAPGDIFGDVITGWSIATP